MRVTSVFGLACTALVASTSSLLVSAAAAGPSNEVASRDRVPIAGLVSARMIKKKHFSARDASTLMSGGDNDEGEAHGTVDVPDGANFTNLDISGSKDTLAVFWTANPNNTASQHAYVMIHGRLRDGGDYWTTMNTVLWSAIGDDYAGADPYDIVTAPQFFSTKYNSGQYTSRQLAWGDVNAWQAGEVATHPDSTDVSAFDALDAFIDEFSDRTKYPAMTNLTFVGHGGGGQLIARYAIVAKDPPSDLYVRYIMGDPSSQPYFTDDRPNPRGDVGTKADCQYYNTWRYGFDNFTGTADGLLSPEAYFQRYVRRDVVSIVGYEDTDASGDTYCMANLQGGTARRDRNLCWYQYVNELGGTDEDVSGFPCTYKNLPDWSNMTGGAISLRLTVVENADHDAVKVFESKEGRSVLFDRNNLEIGWRPDNWTASTKHVTPGVTGLYGTDLSDSPAADSAESVSFAQISSTATSTGSSASSSTTYLKAGDESGNSTTTSTSDASILPAAQSLLVLFMAVALGVVSLAI